MAIGMKMKASESSGTNRRKRHRRTIRITAVTTPASIPILNACPMIKAPHVIGMTLSGRIEQRRDTTMITKTLENIPPSGKQLRIQNRHRRVSAVLSTMST